uniref:Col_cuticle_N domain-containing protein n=2 Tax=Parascaris univalens TaxID=6257 RepID=A0A915A9C5_PARUN
MQLKAIYGEFTTHDEGICMKTISPISVHTSLYLTTPCYFSSNEVCFVFTQNPIYGVEYGCGKANGSMLPRQCGRLSAGVGHCWRRAYALSRVGWLCCCNWPRCNTRNNLIHTIEGHALFTFDTNAESTPQTVRNSAEKAEMANEIALLREEIIKATRARWWHAPMALFVAFTIVSITLLIIAISNTVAKINRLAQEESDFNDKMHGKLQYHKNLQGESVNEYKCKRKLGQLTMTASRYFSCSKSAVKKIHIDKRSKMFKAIITKQNANLFRFH